MIILTALLAGTLFGAGLTISQMLNPQKVLNFFDFAAIASGGWDPTMAVVFAGAMAVMFLGYTIKRRRARPVFDQDFLVPERNDIDAQLIGGSALFGLGWGLTGLCPAPAFSGLALAGPALGELAVFLISLLAGVALSMVLRTSIARRAQASG